MDRKSFRMTDLQPIPMSDATASIAEMEREFNRLRRQIRLAVQERLAKFAGRSMGNLERNQHLATSIHQLLDGHGLRVRCNECGHPAILRVSARNGSPNGVFVFDHTIDGRRTFHGGRRAMPAIVLVAKPPRKKKAAIAKKPSSTKQQSRTMKNADSSEPTDRVAG